jgi:hypothetical protein
MKLTTLDTITFLLYTLAGIVFLLPFLLAGGSL